jgi:hypothetical protein
MRNDNEDNEPVNLNSLIAQVPKTGSSNTGRPLTGGNMVNYSQQNNNNQNAVK